MCSPFRSAEVAPQQEVVDPQLALGFPGRGLPIGGIQSTEGPLVTAIDKSHIGNMLRWITGTALPVGNGANEKLVGGDVIGSSGTPVAVAKGTKQIPASGKHPKDLVKDPGSGPPVPTPAICPCDVSPLEFLFTFTTAPTPLGANAFRRAIIKVAGIDQYDREIDEEIAFPDPTGSGGAAQATDYTKTYTTKNSYKTITSFVMIDVAGDDTSRQLNFASDNIKWYIKAEPNVYRYAFPLTGGRTPFYAVEVDYGTDKVRYPNRADQDVLTATGMVVNQTTFNFGDLIELQLTLMGRKANIGVGLDGQPGLTPKTDVIRPKGELMTNLGAALLIDSDNWGVRLSSIKHDGFHVKPELRVSRDPLRRSECVQRLAPGLHRYAPRRRCRVHN